MAAIFEVHNVLGPGFLEKVYERALATELQLGGLRVELSEGGRGALQGATLRDLFC